MMHRISIKKVMVELCAFQTLCNYLAKLAETRIIEISLCANFHQVETKNAQSEGYL